MKYYLAYGSNLNLNQMNKRCPTSKKVGTATIEGYRLLFKGHPDGHKYLTIEEAEGYSVPVGVFEIQDKDEMFLDWYEGFPHFYYKKGFQIVLNGHSEAIDAFAYIMDEVNKLGAPTPTYYEIVKQGYKDFGFDFNLIEEAIAYSKGQGK